MGADYLEQDVVATSDDELVVMHDIHLDRVTNVANLFPGRERSDGRYYVRDFTLVEIKQLSVNERLKADGLPVYPGRSKPSDEALRVQTFAEELDFIARLQSDEGRSVGIYPEIKRPAWHRQEGVQITPLFLDVLRNFGYDSHSDPVYVQCFDDAELVRIREDHKCELKLIQLIGEAAWGEADTDYNLMRSRDGLSRLATTVDGVGPWINHLYDLGTDDLPLDSGLVSDAHDTGLAVHPFTFRADDLPPGFHSFAELIAYTVDELCIDGLFTDFPDLVLAQISR
jgi:glycerophosphoryl diester phosphodiesterase